MRPDSFAAAVNTAPRVSATYVKSSRNGRTISGSREVTVWFHVNPQARCCIPMQQVQSLNATNLVTGSSDESTIRPFWINKEANKMMFTHMQGQCCSVERKQMKELLQDPLARNLSLTKGYTRWYFSGACSVFKERIFLSYLNGSGEGDGCLEFGRGFCAQNAKLSIFIRDWTLVQHSFWLIKWRHTVSGKSI